MRIRLEHQCKGDSRKPMVKRGGDGALKRMERVLTRDIGALVLFLHFQCFFSPRGEWV